MYHVSYHIFSLPGELSRAILASVEDDEEEEEEVNGRNAVLNRMALVGRVWHNALAPQAGACMPALTRCVTLSKRDMLAAAQIGCEGGRMLQTKRWQGWLLDALPSPLWNSLIAN